MEAIFLKSIYKDYVWGGFKISKQLKNIEKIQIAESLEIISNKNLQSEILNGKYKGKTIEDLFNDKRIKKNIFGSYCENLDSFPLIIKYIDARDNLSVQVHPNDKHAKLLENTSGKNELWYILDCKKDAKVICGIKPGVDKHKLDNLKLDDIDDFFDYLPVEKGDVIYVKAGTFHAILSDILLCEIQQNSDITYRVYDWDRNIPTRPLHIEKSKMVVNTRNRSKVIKPKEKENKIFKVYHCDKFYVDKLSLNKEFEYHTNNESFQMLNIISGIGKIRYNDKVFDIKCGDSILLPSDLGKYRLEGKLEILISYIGKEIN